ncbi:MAG: hypothetical protein PHV79_00380, partial [Clostridia bacterium]|nr:hypothetical protein [Clostridia bacterium]
SKPFKSRTMPQTVENEEIDVSQKDDNTDSVKNDKEIINERNVDEDKNNQTDIDNQRIKSKADYSKINKIYSNRSNSHRKIKKLNEKLNYINKIKYEQRLKNAGSFGKSNSIVNENKYENNKSLTAYIAVF